MFFSGSLLEGGGGGLGFGDRLVGFGKGFAQICRSNMVRRRSPISSPVEVYGQWASLLRCWGWKTTIQLYIELSLNSSCHNSVVCV